LVNNLQLVVHTTIKTMEKEKMNAGGRGITGYRAEYEEQAYNYCLLGATNETLAEFFGVSDTTIKKWMGTPSRRSIRGLRSPFRRAVGYS
jgi:hypothetical protein